MKVDLGIWNNIFSVPTHIIDNHITRCGSVQLKVLLYLLRYPGRDVPIEEIALKLSINPADVHDSLNYWICEGIISNNTEHHKINLEISKKEDNISVSPFNKQIKSNINNAVSPALINLKKLKELEPEKIFSEPIVTAPRLTLNEALERINNDDNLKFLIEETPKILQRNITSTDTIIIISFIDWTGIDIDLVLMLMNYCSSINKRSAKSIEKEAYKWINQGIDTHEKAEKFIKESLKLITIQQYVKDAFHKDYLSEREKAFIKKWVRDFNYDITMIKLAYERAIMRKGEKDFSYINGILLSWFKKGITQPKEIDDENGIKSLKTIMTKSQTKNYGIFKLEKSASFSLDDLKAKLES